MDKSLKAINIDDIQGAPWSLTGDDVNVGQLENNHSDNTHPMLTGLFHNVRADGRPIDVHATQVAGIMMGASHTDGGTTLKGVAPNMHHQSTGWNGSVAGFRDSVDWLLFDPQADIVNMSAGIDFTTNLNSNADWAVATNDMLFVVSIANQGWNSNTNSPRANSMGAPDSGYNVLAVGATGGVVNSGNSSENYRQVAGYSAQGTPGDTHINPDILAPGSLINSATKYWADGDSINGDFMDDDADGRIGLNQSVFQELNDIGVIFQNNAGGAVASLSILDTSGDGTLAGDIIKDGNPGANWTDVNGNNKIDTGDIFHSNLAFDAGDDPDTDFAAASGTSFASPHVSGVASMMHEYSSDKGWGDDSRDHKVIKSVMMNSADKNVKDKSGTLWRNTEAKSNSNTPLDDQLGAGQLDALAAMRLYDAGEHEAGDVPTKGWDYVEALDSLTSKFYSIEDELAEGMLLTATLTWDRLVDRVTDTFTYKGLDDLDIYIHWGDEKGDLDELLFGLSSNSSNSNTEHLWHSVPKAGYYTIEVDWLTNSSGEDTLDYGLAWWSGQLVPEPVSLVQLLVGSVGLLLWRRRRRHRLAT